MVGVEATFEAGAVTRVAGVVGVTGAVGVVMAGVARVAEVAGVTTARTVAEREAGGPLETAVAAAAVEVAVVAVGFRGVGVDRGTD